MIFQYFKRLMVILCLKNIIIIFLTIERIKHIYPIYGKKDNVILTHTYENA